MKKVILSITLALTYSIVDAQVGIGTNDPKATLDVKASTPKGNSTNVDGIIIPRVDRERAQSMVGVEKSTIIFVNDVVSGAQTGTAININSEGFYYFDGLVWIKLPDATQTLKETYWKAQAPSTSPKGEKSTANKSTTVDLVEVDIYQKGKVGIGYDSGNSIDFETNPAQKQLEVGGDFRAFYTQKDTSGISNRFLGIETNSKYAPDGYSNEGTILYNADQKDLRNLFSLDDAFNGNAIIQDKNGLNFSSRSGLNNDLEIISLDVRSNAFNLAAAKGTIIKNYPAPITGTYKTYEKYRFIDFNVNEFKLADLYNANMQMGYDFTKGAFFLGNVTEVDDGSGTIIIPKTQYYFPQTRPAKDKQILEYSQASESLEWVDRGSSSASPQFFYMPSIVLPTTASGVTDYVTYNSTDKTFSVDLYAIYKAQFDAPIKSSNGASTGLAGFVLSRDKYEYHIIYADKNVFPHADIVFSATAGEEGKFTYKVNTSAIIRTGSFMNIVLKVK